MWASTRHPPPAPCLPSPPCSRCCLLPACTCCCCADLLVSLTALMAEQGCFKLLVVDSLTANFRVDYRWGPWGERGVAQHPRGCWWWWCCWQGTARGGRRAGRQAALRERVGSVCVCMVQGAGVVQGWSEWGWGVAPGRLPCQLCAPPCAFPPVRLTARLGLRLNPAAQRLWPHPMTHHYSLCVAATPPPPRPTPHPSHPP